ncbi:MULTISPECIES: alpha-L-glutamate ligase-like protein [unclassified Methylophaga]|jgi:alpha-L-glutamate ligase-like protein|uniref:alpha-L-glutamate ligase-like protein n=2 Tax=Methylophaga TaxID=40222 RepID=UPI000C50D214|nr:MULTISPECIES: alpha-L-glutamate ligase-like protein [unclassified Methylophaga]MAL50296.1 alpha-L-glutamate ligase-like protein [Methylophaga sp.]MAP25995.1 alpha-L-glutamate ligase-like protein [Methylophaga sp.]MBP26230.1 alpha-L-glutamate ligase-like protein [Methylophaga sp.]HAD32444.1 alpha-L-glutamate ligase-like protein [Methylophaga sp.]HCO00704.1 alpha-L-glutamate ligase-like protein [Methylophaga sp.]|tara:strand:+ start:531 stop:1532 length:1002 start_codon:yes stop_codon:yes gene_type:complete
MSEPAVKMNWFQTMRERYAHPGALSKIGVLGMNRRNVSYISRYNPRHLFPLVDDKLQTKELALEAGVKVPDLIGVISEQHAVKELSQILQRCSSGFCIKPAHGSGGKGIMVITRQSEEGYRKSNGQFATISDLERHVSNILAGLFSLGGRADVAIIEDLIHFDDCFSGFSYEGVPDTRVIVFRGFPVMAMMRLSTADSNGKANLHQGAVGVGLDIGDGHALRAVQFDKPILLHPDTGLNMMTLKVPHWEEVLTLAVSCYEMSGLGYLGTDIVLDRFKGPMLLELNARPGLTIQIANGKGLLPRLRQIESLSHKRRMSVADRVAYAREHFTDHR